MIATEKNSRRPEYYMSFGSLVAGLFFVFFKTHFLAGWTSRFITAMGIATLCIMIAYIDKKIFFFASDSQRKRLIIGNWLSLICFLIPVALGCKPGTQTNFALDLFSYCGSICFIAFAFASRIEPILNRMTVPLSKIIENLFPVSLCAYFIIVGTQLAASYNAYTTEWVDFSFEFAPVWQSAHNGLFRMINEFSRETSILSYHWPLMYLIISPLTLLWNKPEAVLWISTFFFTMSGLTVYLLALHYTKNKATASLFGSLYLIYLPVHLANLNDFHADPLALPFIFLSFLGAARRKWVLFGCAATLALLCKEYVGLVYFGYGLWLCRYNKKAGVVTSVVGMAWFLFAIKIGIPYFNRGDAPMVISANFGDIGGNQGLTGILRYAFGHPEQFLQKFIRPNNIVALCSMLLPFMFLPLRNPLILSAGLLILVKNAFSESGIELLAHRETLFFPFIVYAVILFLASASQSKRRFYLCAVTFSTAMTFALQGHAAPARGFWLTKDKYIVNAHDKLCDSLLNTTSPSAVVMSSSHLAAHLMARKWYFLFPRFPTPQTPEFIVIDTLEQADWGWCTWQEHQDGFRRLKNSKSYELTFDGDGIFLFKKRSVATQP
jgi:uncharacterized membrane protein